MPIVHREPRVTVHEEQKRLFLGLITLTYRIEDRGGRRRRKGQPRQPGKRVGRFKHFLDVRVGWKRYTWNFRTTDRFARIQADASAE